MAKKNVLWISHGKETHPSTDRDDCMKCIEVSIEWYKELKKVGGITKLMEKLESETN